MNVLIVSQCEKRALTETRRILDQFAERFGDRTWQTPITQAGLDTLRKVLKKSARRNTAVACHWVRGKNHSELLWIVGNAGRFSAHGAVPTNTTKRNILRKGDENDWHSAQTIRVLAVVAALFHDFGKASRAFQKKLRAAGFMADAYRHEWVSLRLFEAFVGDDGDAQWLERLAELNPTNERSWLKRLKRDDRKPGSLPLKTLPPLAKVIGWLIVSHHRLPLHGMESRVQSVKYLPAPISPAWNGARDDVDAEEKAACWEFPQGIPLSSRKWCARANQSAQAILEQVGLVDQGRELLLDPYVMHLARLTLMLADHHYSSLPRDSSLGDADYPLYANTDRKTREMKQHLDEHLIGVARESRRVAGMLPRLQAQLPSIVRHKGFQKRTQVERFRWQNKAYELATSIRERTAENGFFGINMASTGCGKTLANGRIMYGLADPLKGARFSIALGLRTLTLQTGNAYRERLGLGEDDLAVMVGGAAVRELDALANEEKTKAERIQNGVTTAADQLERCGSESADGLLSETTHVHYEASLEDGPLKQWLANNPPANKLISAPILTCTVDHLVPATESQRGGRQIAPMLRLLTSDLVLDEPDDFDMGDLPALTRLVHWAGVLGSRVLLSSATLPPALVQGLFSAYSAGRGVFEKHRGVVGKPLSVSCAWFDEYQSVTSEHAAVETFAEAHWQFVNKRRDKVQAEPPRRQAIICPASSIDDGSHAEADIPGELAALYSKSMAELHATHHTVDPATNKRVSFGLIRMANIQPIIDVARAMFTNGAPEGLRIHLCVYHSAHPLAVRAAIERELDQVLARHQPDAVFKLPSIKSALAGSSEKDHLFVVLASPVAEVGRDHDYDWAVVEPSSMRSIIQLAGRIRRHRPGPCAEPNLYLLNRNVRTLRGQEVAFEKPGFENKKKILLETHMLEELLTAEQLAQINSGPRIVERPELVPKHNLVDLEHARLAGLMLPSAKLSDLSVHLWWSTPAGLSGELQRAQRFREGAPNITYALVPDEDAKDGLAFKRNDEGRWVDQRYLLKVAPDSIADGSGPRIAPWGTTDVVTELEALQAKFDRDLGWVAHRYGTIQLREQEQAWNYDPALGFQAGR